MAPGEKTRDGLLERASSGHRKRSRSRSPIRHSRSHRHSRRERRDEPRVSKKSHRTAESQIVLPFQARILAKEDYNEYEMLFSQYLGIQKQIDLKELDHDEAKGRWKSFLKKWNRGELAEGWYDPEMLRKSQSYSMPSPEPTRPTLNTDVPPENNQSSSEDDGPGPQMAGSEARRTAPANRSGPAVPSMQDLELKKEQEAEDAEDARESLRLQRKANRAAEKERLDELVPKAMAGTKERQMEKRRELAGANRAFAEAKDADLAEVGEADLMGGDDDGVASYKRQMKEQERKKTEREIRRDEIMRARQEERQQRARDIQAREARTMEGLLALAKQQFG